jgi:ferrous iron transport protein A
MIAARTLTDVPAGQLVRVVGVTGGRALVARLAALGFTPGTPVTPVRNAALGPVIVSLRDTRVALGRREAANVLVTLLPNPVQAADER